jgi:rhodanese-related sulfurtransferase
MLSRLFGKKPEVPETDVAALVRDRAAGKDLQIIDVREPDEYAAGHMPGARLIPLGQLPARTGELDPAKPIVVVCRSGNRSATATEFLLHSGFQDVRNLVGGMIAWAEAGQPVVR